MFFKIFQILLKHFGYQNWWPVDLEYHKKHNTDWRVEVILGAILTQNTRWDNVEKALENLKKNNIKFHAKTFTDIDEQQLANLIKSASFYNVKARRIKNFFKYVVENYKTLDDFFNNPIDKLRNELLSLKGIGKETADVIILYAAEKPIFVVDAYTRRVFSRLGLISGKEEYDVIREMVENDIKKYVKSKKELVKIYKEFHALLDVLAKTYCKKKPVCKDCPLREICPEGTRILISKVPVKR